MASIHKRPGSRFWHCKFTDADGRRRFVSTKQVERGRATSTALEYERAARLATAGELTEGQARRIISDILERAVGESVRSVTVRDYIKEWLQAKQATKAERTHERYETVSRLFLTHLGNVADRPLTAIRTAHVQAFLNARLESGSAPKTTLIDQRILGNAFARALRQGLIQSNPVLACEMPKVISSERSVFMAPQVKLLVDAAKEIEWKTLILLGYFTGARLSDCKCMTWDNVRLDAGVIEYTPRKTEGTSKASNKVVVPIHGDLEKHLLKLAGSDHTEPHLCPSLKDKDSGGAHGLSQTFKALIRSAGLDPGQGKGKGKRTFTKLSFHSLRHSFNSSLADQGVSQEMRMKLTGHKTTSINDRYTHHSMGPLRDAVKKMPGLG